MRFADKMAKILSVQKLGAGPMPTVSPFLFAVYHKDHYPPGNQSMEAPHRGNGMDFDPEADYRMYHGSKVSIVASSSYTFCFLCAFVPLLRDS